jgi:ABC-type polysaccharide/polyol phosphate transport system ATPase subunit
MIRVENLWKSYPKVKDKKGFKEYVVSLPKAFMSKKEIFWALKGVSFNVASGECVGIVGKNGAGKSTLLSALLGSARPSKGTVTVRGKRTPLLALGAGFHPDLSGRENIIINGILLGNTKKEILGKTDSIISFAGTGDFIDMPVRTYSAGMHMRLAFSVAIHTEPEILLIDEILSVGDGFFQKKSAQAIKAIIDNGAATVLVSHDMDAVREICTRVIWLDQGVIKADGKPREVTELYLNQG